MRHLLLPLLLLLTACQATTHVETQHRVLTDTIHLAVRDTTHHVLIRDTTIVTSREYITEHIIQRYDSVTGRLTQQEIARTISRRADSLAAHRLDSLMHASHLHTSRARADSAALTLQHQRQPALTAADRRPLWQRILGSSLGLLILIAIITWLCLKCWLRKD